LRIPSPIINFGCGTLVSPFLNDHTSHFKHIRKSLFDQIPCEETEIQIDQWCLDSYERQHLLLLIFLISGLVAGTLATAATHPPDVIKTRLQTQFHITSSTNATLFPQKRYKGTFEALIKIYRVCSLINYIHFYLFVIHFL
jgi:hypothetical protein